jgi:hypothetical protein
MIHATFSHPYMTTAWVRARQATSLASAVSAGHITIALLAGSSDEFAGDVSGEWRSSRTRPHRGICAAGRHNPALRQGAALSTAPGPVVTIRPRSSKTLLPNILFQECIQLLALLDADCQRFSLPYRSALFVLKPERSHPNASVNPPPPDPVKK